MESTYINTGHPDFISGHKAMAIVSDRMNASKPPPAVIDPKTGKLPPGTLNNGRDLDSDLKQKEEGFFGSFWPGGKKPPAKKAGGASTMEAVSMVCAVCIWHGADESRAALTAASSSSRVGNAFRARDDGDGGHQAPYLFILQSLEEDPHRHGAERCALDVHIPLRCRNTAHLASPT